MKPQKIAKVLLTILFSVLLFVNVLSLAAFASEATVPGDINGDGKVNLKDVVLLYRYVAGWDVDVNLDALDANGDNVIDIRDAVTIFKNKAGHKDVVIHGHTHSPDLVAAKEPTRTEDGNIAYYYCQGCTQYFSDSEAKNKITRESTILYATGSLGLEFTLNEDGETYSVTGIGTCTDTEVYIPAVYEGKKVTGVGDWAFAQEKSFTNIIIPSGVTSIGTGAFSFCSGLTSITISDSVTSIGIGTFESCTSLINLTIPHSVTSIDNGAFLNCSNLTSVTISPGVVSIGAGVFRGCSSLTSITIPASVTFIGGNIFAACASLTSIEVDSGNTIFHSQGNCLIATATKTLIAGCKNSAIPTDGSVTSIGKAAFSSCSGLINVTIPDSIIEIGESAFEACSNLTSITIPTSVTGIGGYAFLNCSILKTIIYEGAAEEWVTVYKGPAWNSGCSFIMEFAFPHEHIPIIDPAVAPTCIPGLTEGSHCELCYEVIVAQEIVPAVKAHNKQLVPGMSLSPTCTQTGYNVYICIDCSSYMIESLYLLPHSLGEWTVEVPATKTTDGSKYAVCSVCGEVITEVIPATGSLGLEFTLNEDGETYSVTGIGTCTDTEVYIPAVYEGKKVTEIGKLAFRGCSSLTNITIPDSVTNIGDYAFYGCSSLASITIPVNVTSIGDSSFGWCSNLTSISIPKSVTSIGYSAFYQCTSLISINISNGVKSIGVEAFSGCESLTSISIPDSVTSIGGYAFQGCTSLIDITIPDSVASIDQYVFYSCNRLTNIKMPNSVKSIGEYAFGHCLNLTTFIYEGTAEEWEAVTKGYGWNLDCKFTVTFLPKSHQHEIMHALSFEACHFPGNVEYWYCTGCKLVFANEACTIITNLKNVTIEPQYVLAYVPAAEPCHVAGTAEYWYCPGCDAVYTDAEGKHLTNHKNLEIAPICELTYVPAVEACHVAGMIEYWYCQICDAVYLDAEGTIITNRKNLEVPAVSGREIASITHLPTCTDPGFTQNVCTYCGETWISNYVDALGGECIPVTDPAVEPTCTTTGLTEGSHCSVCGKILVAQTELPIKHISPVAQATQNPSCTRQGYTYYICTYCGMTYFELIDPLGHTEGEWIVDHEATETKDGSKHQICSVCGETIKNEIILRPGATEHEHSAVVDPAVAPDRCKPGLTEGSHCELCGEVIVIQGTVPAVSEHDMQLFNTITSGDSVCTNTEIKIWQCSVCKIIEYEQSAPVGHTAGEWTIDKEATNTEDGSKHSVCTVCGTTITETIPATGE